MKKYLLPVFLVFASLSTKAQQIPHFSQYYMNHYMVNPAATGTTDNLPLSLVYRKLWAGIKNSPSVQMLSGNMKVYKDMGVGAKLFNNQTGPVRKTGVEGTYSYHLNLGTAGTKISFGLSGLIYQYFLNKSELKVEDNTDEAFLGTEKMIVPDASFGMYLYNEKYYAGISIPQLFQKNIDLKSDKILQQKQVRHYYLHGGYRFEAGSDFKLEPSLLLKFVEQGIFQADINAQATYRDFLSFGVSFRTSDAIVINLGYKSPVFQAGYSFDLTITPLHNHSYGSHEIVLIYFLDNFLNP
jgi:type IX secretion system PorP/SprF family membrane protein